MSLARLAMDLTDLLGVRELAVRIVDGLRARGYGWLMTWLMVLNLLAGAALVCVKGECWAVRSPLFRVMGALSTEVSLAITWLGGVGWWLFTSDWSVCTWAKKLLGTWGMQPYRSAAGMLGFGLVCLWLWRRRRGPAHEEPRWLGSACLLLTAGLGCLLVAVFVTYSGKYAR
jgi:hypothetical protein